MKINNCEVTCSDCYFRRASLCALQLEEPCPTFRHHVLGVLGPPQPQRLAPRPLDEIVRRACCPARGRLSYASSTETRRRTASPICSGEAKLNASRADAAPASAARKKSLPGTKRHRLLQHGGEAHGCPFRRAARTEEVAPRRPREGRVGQLALKGLNERIAALAQQSADTRDVCLQKPARDELEDDRLRGERRCEYVLSAARSSSATSAAGSTRYPTRSPGATIFEKDDE